jgi:tRNA(Ser,Leu) C12 N-acetylase TAN1
MKFGVATAEGRYTMSDWNIVVSVREGSYARACKILEKFGPVSHTDFFNVLVMKVDDIQFVLDELRTWMLEDPESLSFLTRLVPVTHTFVFQSPQEFEVKAKKAVLSWAPQLAKKAFHVRMRRRGFKGRLSSEEEERLLDKVLLDALEDAKTPGHITFGTPDAIIAVEIVGSRAGLSLWTSEDLKKYPFIRLK